MPAHSVTVIFEIKACIISEQAGLNNPKKAMFWLGMPDPFLRY